MSKAVLLETQYSVLDDLVERSEGETELFLHLLVVDAVLFGLGRLLLFKHYIDVGELVLDRLRYFEVRVLILREQRIIN